jgi:tetratricopeptide (TPR) repeat protein
MLTIVLSLVLAAVTAAAVYPIFWTWYAPIPPAVLVGGVAFYLLSRWRTGLVQREMGALVALLQERRVADAEALIDRVRAKHGRWVLLLDQQLSVQKGMLRYAQGKFDEAEPMLRAGQWNNWQAHVALAAIHHRRAEQPKVWEHLEKAASAQPREAMVYAIWAVLATRADDRDRALKALGKGLAKLPGSKVLLDLQGRVSNKKKIDVKQLPQTWYHFFPEDLVRPMLVRGRKGGPPELPPGVTPRIQQPYPQPRMGRKARR